MRSQVFPVTVLLSLALVGCSSPEPGPVLTSGIWRSTETYDAGQSQTTAPITGQIYEFNFAAGTVVGWRYGCEQGWINCAPKGYGLALTGTVSKGVGDFEFIYKPTSSGTSKVQITGTFSTGGFVGRFKRTNSYSSKPEVGAVTMIWLQSQR
jgi:hypothetical protein